MTKEGLKIATIGAGSSYTPEFAEGLILRSKSLKVKEWYLVDIKEGEEKLKIVSALVKRMFKKAGLDTKIIATLDRKEAIKNANFVTTQFRVGGLEARLKDEEIPLKRGYIGQETNGAGGLFKALRTIPVILDLCKEMHELCPNAYLINFTNPAGMVTQAAIEEGGFEKSIGLCNVPVGIHKGIENFLNLKEGQLDLNFAGLNHFSFVLNVYVDGKDEKTKVLDCILKNQDDTLNPANFLDLKWPKNLLHSLKSVPSPYHSYYFLQEDMLAKELEEFKKHGTRALQVQKIEHELFEIYKNENLKEKPKQLEERGGAYYSDIACGIIDAIANNKNEKIVANVRNNSTIACLPEHACIEASCIVNNTGANALATKNIPFWMENWFNLVFAYQDLTIKAATFGDFEALLHAFYINPLTPCSQDAEDLAKELLKAHANYLPQFSHIINKL